MADRSTHVYKYQEIYDYYKSMIITGKLLSGQRLPTEQAIQKLFCVSRITVTKAMNMLADSGLIYRQKGKGTFVSHPPTKKSPSAPPVNDIAFISLIMSFNPTGYENQLLENIEKEVRNAGYLLSISNTYGNPEEERKCILSVKNTAAGIIVYPATSIDNLDLYFTLFKEKYPIVFIDRAPSLLPCTCVSSDNYDGGHQIGEWLTKHNHKNFAALFHNLSFFSSESARYAGFVDALKKSGISSPNLHLFSLDPDTQQDFTSLVSTIVHPKNPENPITAVFTCNDITALQLITQLKKADFSPSYPLIISGFDGLYSLNTAYPFITLKQNYARIGQIAVKKLLEFITNSPSYFKENINIPVELHTYNINN